MKNEIENQIENANLEIKKLKERITELNENVENLALIVNENQEKIDIMERILRQKEIMAY
jgi:predicted  nucleic acid-binding Zn-ribbon protein